jgi:hypothetical protein
VPNGNPLELRLATIQIAKFRGGAIIHQLRIHINNILIDGIKPSQLAKTVCFEMRNNLSRKRDCSDS